MKNQYQTYIALYLTIDYLYHKCPCDSTALCAGELDPFLFRTIGSADPAHYIEFGKEYKKRFNEVDTSREEEAFEFTKEYTSRLSAVFQEMYPEDDSISALFEKYIDKQIWHDIWVRAKIVANQQLAKLDKE